MREQPDTCWNFRLLHQRIIISYGRDLIIYRRNSSNRCLIRGEDKTVADACSKGLTARKKLARKRAMDLSEGRVLIHMASAEVRDIEWAKQCWLAGDGVKVLLKC